MINNPYNACVLKSIIALKSNQTQSLRLYIVPLIKSGKNQVGNNERQRCFTVILFILYTTDNSTLKKELTKINGVKINPKS